VPDNGRTQGGQPISILLRLTGYWLPFASCCKSRGDKGRSNSGTGELDSIGAAGRFRPPLTRRLMSGRESNQVDRCGVSRTRTLPVNKQPKEGENVSSSRHHIR
jgi:hypothetical protein